MISKETISRSWEVFAREWAEQGKPMGWCRIEWELWIKNTHIRVCQNEAADKGRPKCENPCSNCIHYFRNR